MFCQAFDKAKRNTPMYFPQNNHTKKFELMCLLYEKKKARQNSFVGRLLVLTPSAKSESKSRPFGVARFCFQLSPNLWRRWFLNPDEDKFWRSPDLLAHLLTFLDASSTIAITKEVPLALDLLQRKFIWAEFILPRIHALLCVRF